MRVSFMIAAAALLSGCSYFSVDECSRDARAELRTIDAQIARAQADAQSSFAANLLTNGARAPFICRQAGDVMVECTALPAPERGKLPYDWSIHDPQSRLAGLDAERQRILARMMACQSG